MSIFSGQVAVITGASRGIGQAIAQALTIAGATVCLIGRDLITLKQATAVLPTDSSKIFYYQADLLIDTEVQQLAEMLQQDHGRVDLLIHSAGVIALGNVATATIADFDWQYRVNVRAPYLLTQQLLPLIKAQQGQIVFINSSVCQNARAGISQYTATKQALKAIADCLRAEVNGDGVRVVSAYVGRTATPMQAAIHQATGQIYQPEIMLQPEDIAHTLLHTMSLSPTAEITDVNIRPFQK
jgi:NADP-dependent 3-hydroxy acid dehydrogenase YdfG